MNIEKWDKVAIENFLLEISRATGRLQCTKGK